MVKVVKGNYDNMKLIDSSDNYKNLRSKTSFYIGKSFQFLKSFLLSLKGVLFIIWFYFFYKLGSNKSEFLNTYFILSLIALIFYNLSRKKTHGLSAYSIFNKGNQRLLGDFNIDNIERMYGVNRNRNGNNNANDE